MREPGDAPQWAVERVLPPICTCCSRFHQRERLLPEKPGLTCDAFPAGILEAIWHNEVDHHFPVEGDRGIRFEPATDALDKEADQIITEARAMGILKGRRHAAGG